MSLIATTTRRVTFVITGADKVVRHSEALPAGTEVYVGRIRNGRARVRVVGTLLEQEVILASSVTVP